MGAGRLTTSPPDALRARPAICRALDRASVNSDAGEPTEPNTTDALLTAIAKAREWIDDLFE